MASYNISLSISLSATSDTFILLASPECLQPTAERFDLPTSFSLDFNIVSEDAVGVLNITAQNDEVENSSEPNLSFPVAGGTYANSQTKQIIENNGATFTKYLYVKYERISGSGTLQIAGQKSFK